jgi:hypothetical protein
MILALGPSGYLLILLPLIYGAAFIGSMFALIWTLIHHRWNVTLFMIATLSVILGGGLLAFILMQGITLPQQWPDLLIPIIPLICGSITIARLFRFRHQSK